MKAGSFRSAVTEDLPGLDAGEGVLDASTDVAVCGVVLLLSCHKLLAWGTPVREEQPGPPHAREDSAPQPPPRRYTHHAHQRYFIAI